MHVENCAITGARDGSRRRNGGDMEPPLPNNLEAERAVLGTILRGDNTQLASVCQILRPEDFALSENAFLFRTMLGFADAGKPIDLITLTDFLEGQKEIGKAGGVPYIASLTDGLYKVSNVVDYARIVKEKAVKRSVIHATELVQHNAFNGETAEDVVKSAKARIEAIEKTLPQENTIRTVTAKELCQMQVAKREFLLDPWITSRSIGELFAWRGTGKTFVLLGIAHAVATGTKFLKFEAPKPARVLVIDGELDPATLQDRAKLLGAHEDENLSFLCVDMLEDGLPHLATSAAQQIIEAEISRRQSQLVFFDNLAALAPSTNETEAEDWVSIQVWLKHLKKEGIASAFVNHAGHAGWSRGTTRREDLLDWVCKLEWPKDYNPDQGLRFELRFTKTRAYMRDAAHPIEASFRTDVDGDVTWTFADIEDARMGQILELRSANTSWREIEALTGIPRSTAERIWRNAGKSKK